MVCQLSKFKTQNLIQATEVKELAEEKSVPQRDLLVKKEILSCVGEGCASAAFGKCLRKACLSCCRSIGNSVGCEEHEGKLNKRKQIKEEKRQNHRERKKSKIGN